MQVVEKYLEWERRHEELVNKATLIVAKQRHGSTGNVPLLFHSEFTKFSSPARDEYGNWDDADFSDAYSLEKPSEKLAPPNKSLPPR